LNTSPAAPSVSTESETAEVAVGIVYASAPADETVRATVCAESRPVAEAVTAVAVEVAAVLATTAIASDAETDVPEMRTWNEAADEAVAAIAPSVIP
jgi:hypothetical protein